MSRIVTKSEVVRVNLLDWRGARRERKRQRFLTYLVGAAVVSVLLVGVIPMLYYNHLIDAQQARNRYLEDQIATADQQLTEIRALKKKRDNLITRMRIIEQLQRSRSAIVHYFDQLVATVPEGVYLTSLTQDGDTTTLNGVAESNKRVSDYMINLDRSTWFDDPRLIVIKSSEQGPRRYADFQLKITSINPEAPTPEQRQTTDDETSAS